MGVVGEIRNRLEQIGRDKRGWDDSRHGNVYVGRNEERWIDIYIYIYRSGLVSGGSQKDCVGDSKRYIY